jgi:hypothetical protein
MAEVLQKDIEKRERKPMQQKKHSRNPSTISSWSMFFSPLITLDSLREKPRWLLPILVSAIVSAAVNFYIIQHIGLVHIIEALSRNKALIDPQGAMENAIARQNQILGIQAGIAFIGPILIALAIATVLWLLLILFGYTVPWKKGLAVVAHANMLSIVLRECMTALTVTLIADTSKFDMNNPLATNLAFLLKPVSPAAFRALSSLDVITFMNMALIIFGLTKMCTNLSKVNASMIVGIPWMIYVGGMLVAPALVS